MLLKGTFDDAGVVEDVFAAGLVNTGCSSVSSVKMSTESKLAMLL